MSQGTQYVLIDAKTRERIWHPVPFNSALAAGLFALIHDIHNYEVQPVAPIDDTLPLNLIF